MVSNDNSSVSTSKSANWPRLFRLFLIVSLISMVTIMLMAHLGLQSIFRNNVIAEAEWNALHISTALRDFEIQRLAEDSFDGTGRARMSLVGRNRFSRSRAHG